MLGFFFFLSRSLFLPQGKSGGGDNVMVCVRVRPMNKKEQAKGFANITTIDQARGTVTIAPPKQDAPPKTYTFDCSFPSDVRQLDVYNKVARPIVDSVLEGYNGTVFAYGQTGTGKTFSMEGDRSVPELKGIIPNSFAHIFGEISKAEGQTQFLVRCSYLEIYCEDVTDLLGKDPTAKLQVKEHPDTGVYVKGLSDYSVKSVEEMEAIMTRGNKNRSVGATNMNEHSSRSHAIFTITVERSEPGQDGEEHVRMGKLHLVDLAGSERQSKTGAEGDRLKEATKINWSLSALGNVISTLVDGKSKHIPYRDSKLTRLLQDSLGGNAKTLMIATFGPADYNYEETISTLRYADRAKRIKNKPKINEDPKDALLRQYLEELQELRAQLEGEGGYVGSDDDEDEEEDDEEGSGAVGWDGQKLRKPRRKSRGKKRPISPSKVKQIQAEIDREREALKLQSNMAAEEKTKAEQALRSREQDLERQRAERTKLQQQVAAVESKLVVGGVNLLDKASKQQELLERAQTELQAREAEQMVIAQALDDVEQEQLDLEQKYSSLEEEKEGKSKKLKKVYDMYLSAKAEMKELEDDFNQQLEGLNDICAGIELDVELCDMILSRWVPPEYQNVIERLAVWNEAIGDWQIPALPHTGNNILKTNPQPVERAPTPVRARCFDTWSHSHAREFWLALSLGSDALTILVCLCFSPWKCTFSHSSCSMLQLSQVTPRRGESFPA
ncbi:uncharacterized protein MONBRDRAFT_16629 [Monosiga brevicollis MX1]|uniref:Kinesin-like protein n=1 Tax=Monosiga brevicollis TaxID=81824 RepID=A9UY06_MONBE|nr:uncharacterized protein MONBRDRAFT_16629 [Monosiga brevicollis MX1]EDQ89939.1 predicted protein [Monosiga brevicollis MX1]|eukprot:XP_001745361.1 hypothetical protein [Monosiga brevicollis MX1]